MFRTKVLALAIAALPLAPLAAEASSPLARVSTHLKAISSLSADFTQTDRRGNSVGGTMLLKKPGKIRFQYEKGVPMLIVGDGKRLNMIDYEVKRVESWPVGKSPLGVLLNPDQNLARVATVVQNDAQVLMVRARDPERREFGTINLAFAKIPSGPAGLVLRGWTVIDAQNNRTTVRLSNQRYNVAIADSAFRWTDPRQHGPRG